MKFFKTKFMKFFKTKFFKKHKVPLTLFASHVVTALLAVALWDVAKRLAGLLTAWSACLFFAGIFAIVYVLEYDDD